MKNFKKIFGAFMTLAVLLLCLTGCMEVNMGVEIKEDGKAALTSKILIEEDAYLTLTSFESEPGSDVSVSGDSDLDDFVKEVIDGKTYYTLSETKEFESYEELATMLKSDNGEEGSNLFSAVEITGESNVYTFSATSAVMEGYEEVGGSDNWLKVTMDITMPGEITETNGEQIDENTARFTLSDFTDAQTLSVSSQVIKFGARDAVLIFAFFAIIGGLIGFLVWRKKTLGHL